MVGQMLQKKKKTLCSENESTSESVQSGPVYLHTYTNQALNVQLAGDSFMQNF